ncbi:methyl-CpG-binding domain-containing protein 5-like [Pyrus ussuriensis x Pyrus communis]|uniref:Methyl-CpG-binding domain-containing protein 5-like n=1 Tax=Pyrus ussuriensis x Pyrus communis TaxID=2448454 RepID=A0A5N5HYY9_9ROSA|nr:methyl-CpG-binding domain-containing protein 5-like [Pyrus ussuriensis x Pyrus communis]
MEESNSSLLPPKTGMETMKAKSGNLTGDFKVTNAIPRLRVPPVVNHFDGTNFGLPEGWTVKQKSMTSPKYFGIKDKTFLHRQTGKRFRSLVAAKKWIKENRGEKPHEAFQAADVSKVSS